jgi:hypothetical protein
LSTVNIAHQVPTRLTTIQSFWLSIQVAVLLGVVACQLARNFDAAALLWTAATGIRLTLWALVLIAGNFVALWAGAWAIRRVFRAESGIQPFAWLTALYVGCLYFLYLPALFILWIGPSALQIQANLLN